MSLGEFPRKATITRLIIQDSTVGHSAGVTEVCIGGFVVEATLNQTRPSYDESYLETLLKATDTSRLTSPPRCDATNNHKISLGPTAYDQELEPKRLTDHHRINNPTQGTPLQAPLKLYPPPNLSMQYVRHHPPEYKTNTTPQRKQTIKPENEHGPPNLYTGNTPLTVLSRLLFGYDGTDLCM